MLKRIIDRISSKVLKSLEDRIFNQYFIKNLTDEYIESLVNSIVEKSINKELINKKFEDKLGSIKSWKDFVSEDYIKETGKRHAEEKVKKETDELLKYHWSFAMQSFSISSLVNDAIKKFVERSVGDEHKTKKKRTGQ